jgi:aspartate/methionine/tyrosine aminotransferase
VLRQENEFRADVDELESLITPKTRMIIINTPQNPTGSVLTKEDIRRIADLAIKHDLIIFSDEIYSRIMYDGAQHVSIASLPGMKERTIILDGFSKTYAMTGWRLGFGIFPKEIATLVARLQTNCTSCTSSFTQMAGIQALRGPQNEAEAFVLEFKRRRDAIVDGLNGIKGITCVRPHGAFYVFPNIEGTGKDSKFLADYLMNEAGVACLSGTAFGAHGNGFLRFSYANSIENIQQAVKQIKTAVEKL